MTKIWHITKIHFFKTNHRLSSIENHKFLQKRALYQTCVMVKIRPKNGNHYFFQLPKPALYHI